MLFFVKGVNGDVVWSILRVKVLLACHICSCIVNWR